MKIKKAIPLEIETDDKRSNCCSENCQFYTWYDGPWCILFDDEDAKATSERRKECLKLFGTKPVLVSSTTIENQ